MSTWIRVIDRIACAVAVQVQSLRLRPASAVGVLGQEAAVFRAVVAGVEVVETGCLIVDASTVADFVVEIVFSLLGGLTVIGVAVGLLRYSVLADYVDGALAQILGVGVELYGVALSRSGRRKDVILPADQIEAADRIVLILGIKDCCPIIEIFSCLRVFLFFDSLSKSIILVLLGIINQSALPAHFLQSPLRRFSLSKGFSECKIPAVHRKNDCRRNPSVIPLQSYYTSSISKILFYQCLQLCF